jgi:hypothetical protein
MVKHIVNSFDVFDTILARRCCVPTDIFDMIEKTYPFSNFKKIRIQSEQNALTFEDIYSNFQKLTNISDEEILKLKEFEFQTEINNSYLIMSNYNLINDGDILVSDMYLSATQISKLLISNGFKKNVLVYSSSKGKSKHNGSMYTYLKTKHTIERHIGDNQHSDIFMAKQHNIYACLSTIHARTKVEQFFIDNGCYEFAFMLREFRHTNPYEENTYNFHIFNDQCSVNIPILIYISQKLNVLMSEHKKDTLLCVTRDGCLLEQIFPLLYPHYTCKRFESSRRIHLNYNEEYKDYVKTMYNDNCILFDINGSFRTGRPLYIEVFNKLPDIYIFSYDFYASEFPGLFYSITSDNVPNSFMFEHFNYDIVGTLLEMKNGEFIRRDLEYNINDVLLYKNTIKDFCDFLKTKSIPNILHINIVDLCNSIIRESTIKIIRPKNYVDDGIPEFAPVAEDVDNPQQRSRKKFRPLSVKRFGFRK